MGGCLAPGARQGRRTTQDDGRQTTTTTAHTHPSPLQQNSSPPHHDGTHNHFGTAGGDAAELAAAITVYCRLLPAPAADGNGNDPCPPQRVERIFRRFMNEVASPARPFYLHQADGKVQKVLDQVAASGLVPERPSALPAVAPADPALREAYLDSLVEGHHQGESIELMMIELMMTMMVCARNDMCSRPHKSQKKTTKKNPPHKKGCGHLRLMIDRYPDYGLDSPSIPQSLIRAFYNYWWPTPAGSPERAKIEFPLLQGELHGSSILIVGAAASSGECAHHSPAIPHSSWGAQSFVLNADAVSDFRARVLAPFFARVAREEASGGAGAGAQELPASFGAELEALTAKQLGATLTHLDVANEAPRMFVTY